MRVLELGLNPHEMKVSEGWIYLAGRAPDMGARTKTYLRHQTKCLR